MVTRRTRIRSSPPWAQVAWGAVAPIGLTLFYLLAFQPKWREQSFDKKELGDTQISVEKALAGNAPPRDFYSLPCTRWTALRRLWAKYTAEGQILGEIYSPTDS